MIKNESQLEVWTLGCHIYGWLRDSLGLTGRTSFNIYTSDALGLRKIQETKPVNPSSSERTWVGTYIPSQHPCKHFQFYVQQKTKKEELHNDKTKTGKGSLCQSRDTKLFLPAAHLAPPQ